ncbi:MAG: helix-turn-helix transcriptional regulator [Aquirufa sp.]
MFNQNRILRVFKFITLLKTFPAKSIKRLAATLEISERSCYRYMDLLAELGFQVEKDQHNKFFLQDQVPYFDESNRLASTIVHGHLAKLLAQINEAIKEQKQVILHKYQSASSESIADRLVEPIGFTANYTYLCAYEPADAQNKYFKLERMGSIEILAETYKFKEAHVLLTPDVFGFNDSGEKFPIKLKLSMRAMLFLKDDYPATADYLTDQKDDSWFLEVEVNSMEPVERILRGMPGEVEVINS